MIYLYAHIGCEPNLGVPGALLPNLKASSHINITASLWAAVVLFTDGTTEAKGDQKVRISRSCDW